MVSRVCNDPSPSKDDFAQVTVKKELVEETNRPMMENESSHSKPQTKSNLLCCKRKRVADEHINANPSPSKQNEKGIPESSGPANPSREFKNFEDFELKQECMQYDCRKPVSAAMVEANHIQLAKSPSFIKSVVKSHMRGSIFLPRPFCTLHFPKGETMITLEDEKDNKFEVKYIPTWMGLSAGWKKFTVANNLHEGDVLLFHLVDPKKFKIYIIRVDDCQVNDDPSLLHSIEQGGSESPEDVTDQSIDLGTFAEFLLKIRSLCLESELDEDTLKKYYKLCCSKKYILHNRILNLNDKLVAGIIEETVYIAGALKACDIFTPTEKLEQWGISLRSFKHLGMEVEFLVERVSRLLKLRVGYEGTRFADEMKNLAAEHAKLKEAYEKVGVDIKNLKSKSEMHEVKFQQVVDSPW